MANVYKETINNFKNATAKNLTIMPRELLYNNSWVTKAQTFEGKTWKYLSEPQEARNTFIK